jgi:tetratricopeptide (TPR) repeat protein
MQINEEVCLNLRQEFIAMDHEASRATLQRAFSIRGGSQASNILPLVHEHMFGDYASAAACYDPKHYRGSPLFRFRFMLYHQKYRTTDIYQLYATIKRSYFPNSLLKAIQFDEIYQDYDEADRLYDQCLLFVRRAPRLLGFERYIFLFYGLFLKMRRRDIDGCIRIFNEALHLDQNYSEIHFQLAVVLMAEKRDWTKAKQHFLYVRRINTAHVDSAALLGAIGLIEGDAEEGLRFLEPALRSNSLHRVARYCIDVLGRFVGSTCLSFLFY